MSHQRACCCSVCESQRGLDVTLAAGPRCDPCYVGAAGWQVTSLAVDGTYTVDTITSAPGDIQDREDTFTVGGAAHLKDYFQFAGACTGTLLYEHDCDDVKVSVRIDCGDLNGAGQPRVLIVAIRVRFENCHGDRAIGEDWQDGYGNYINNPPSYVFRYDQGLHGGSYYLGDTIPNGYTACVDLQLATGGTVVVNPA